jgi:hypothetical protein
MIRFLQRAVVVGQRYGAVLDRGRWRGGGFTPECMPMQAAAGKKNFLLALLPAMPAQIFPSVSVVCPANGLSGYFFVAEGSLPHCPSTPFARQVQASRPPLLRMLSLRIGPLLAPLSVWRRPLSVDTCPLVMTYKANTGQTRRFLQCIEPGGKPPSPRRSRRSDFPSRLIQSDCRV